MYKLGGGKHATIWQQRFFVLKKSSLYYYKGRDDAVPKGVIRLIGCSYYLVKATDKPNHFRLKHPSFKTRDLSTSTEVDLQLWEAAIQKAIKDAAASCEHIGWLYKKDKSGKRSWKRRFAIITCDRKLRYFEDPDDLAPKGEINLAGCKFASKNSNSEDLGTSMSSSMGSSQHGKAMYFSVVTSDQTRQFYTEGGLMDFKSWKKSIEAMSVDKISSGRSGGSPEQDLVKCGYLLKKGGGSKLISRKNWKRRYFRFDGSPPERSSDESVLGTLEWFSSKHDLNRLGCIVLRRGDGQVRDSELKKYNHTFSIKGTEGKKTRNLQLRAEDYETMEAWVSHVNNSLSTASALEKEDAVEVDVSYNVGKALV